MDLNDGSLLSPSGAYRPPTVESAPDSMQPSRTGSVPAATPFAAPPPNLPLADDQERSTEHDVSPIEPSDSAARQGSVGGGYFPSIPTFTSDSNAPTMPTADADFQAMDTRPDAPNENISPAAHPKDDMATPRDFYNQPSAPPPVQYVPPPTIQARPPPPAAVPAPAPLAIPPGGYRTDDESILLAQKHAKWAMSALNFEDVETAVKELRLALHTLGAA